MEKITYVVTEAAGPNVAGRRVIPGDELQLTEFEARFELLAGSVLEKKPIEPSIAESTIETPIVENGAPPPVDERPSKKR